MGTFSDLVANSWLDAVCRATAYAEAGRLRAAASR